MGTRGDSMAMQEGRTHRGDDDDHHEEFRDSPGRRTRRRRDDKEDSPGRRRHRDRDERERARTKRRRKHDSSDSDWPISASTTSSSTGSSPSDESSDGERRKRDRKRRKEKRKTRRRSERDKSEDKSKDKKRKKSRHRDKDRDNDNDDNEREKKRRLVKEAKRFLKRHKQQEELNSSEIQASGRKVEKISADDYFLKSSEFATWLKEDRGVYFSDLSSEETHNTFEAFVDKWNDGKLHPKYYDGIKEAPRTNHNWAIKKGPEDTLIVDEEEEYALAKKKDRYERKKFQKEHEVILDEILPKATGRERQMEKKAIRREQARAREDSPEIMKERDVMGGGGDFQQRLAREKAWKEKKQSEKLAVYNEKLTAFEEKETAAMDQLRALVNVAGGKITIAKRQ